MCGALLALGFVARCDAASGEEAFKPDSGDFVVLRLAGTADREPFATLRSRTAADPRLTGEIVASYLERARREQDPALIGRAETLLKPWMREDRATAPLLILQADIAQWRHDFPGAVEWLDRAVVADRSNARARLMRASIAIVRGETHAALPDCQAVLAAGELHAGTVCLAQTIGGGNPQRASRLVGAVLSHDSPTDAGQRAWSLAVLADFEQRLGNLAAAEKRLREAHRLAPNDESFRVQLADLLLESGRPQDALMLPATRPSGAMLVQRARAQRSLGRNDELRHTLAIVDEQLSIEARRGERIHLREAALLALHVRDDRRGALETALMNFQVQREAIDIRLLARAARAANDAAAIEALASWIDKTGYRDVAVEQILERP